jgi:hypothetical protein
MAEDPSVALRPQDDSLLRDLASSPRPTGSAAIAAARERCARELRQLGYEVRERPFTYSALPGRYATPLFGAAVAMLVGFAGTQALEGSRFVPALILGLGGVALAVAGRWLARRGVLEAPVLREAGVNLECVLPGEIPHVWLCAHLDSKSQPIPTLVRSAGIVIEAVGFLSALAIAVATAMGIDVHDFFWAFAGVVTLVGTIPVGLSMVGSRSPGALDNASGVTAVIAAARLLERRAGVGVLITDAEELGLAGARAWAQGRDDDVVLNCDGVDDDGEVTIMNSSPALQVFAAATTAAKAKAIHVDFSRMFPGVLMDSVAFADAGMRSVTVSRGTFGSFARVHSERDDLAHLRGDGIAPTAALLAEVARLFASTPNTQTS